MKTATLPDNENVLLDSVDIIHDASVNNVNAQPKTIQLSSQCIHKLHRSGTVSSLAHIALMEGEVRGTMTFLSPHLFSYLHEDIAFVHAELRNQGLCGAPVGKDE